MTDTVEVEGGNVDEAIEKALEKLGVSREEVDIEVVEQPSKGLLGIGAKGAKIRITLKNNSDVKAADVVREILALMDIDAGVSAEESADSLLVNISGENLGMLIGRHGHTLDALQYLVNISVNKKNPSPRRIIVDVERYRQERTKEVKALAERMVGKVLAGQRTVTLRPMNAYERKIVHTVVGEYPGVSSSSSGEEPERQVVISPA